MSDLDRNYASPFGRAAGRVDAATVDAGLRAYMLRIYNYMSIGLAITGLAALGVYMAAVTPDQAGAAAWPELRSDIQPRMEACSECVSFPHTA